jgi:hypothetical protein
MSIALLLSGGVLAAGGATALADAGRERVPVSQQCGANGCITISRLEDDPSQRSHGVAMLAGGAATALFGGMLLGHHLGESKPFPHRSSGRLGAGMLLTGYGVGTTVGASALIMHAAVEGSDVVAAAFFMYVPGVALLATGMPLWITGSRPPERGGPRRGADDEKEIFRSPTMASVGIGMMGLGLGIVGGGIGAALEGERREEEEQDEMTTELGFFDNSDRPESAVSILGTMTAGVALFSLGVPFAVIGLGRTTPHEAHASAPTLPVPELQVGMGSATVTWRY